MSKIKLNETLDEQNMEFLTDLCSRIPYEVICSIYRIDDSCVGWRDSKLEGFISNEIGFEFYFEDMVTVDNNLKKIKPYLRSLDSITDDEIEELKSLADKDLNDYAGYLKEGHGLTRDGLYKLINPRQIFWFLKNHFDINDLIPKGLAIKVTEEYNPYNKED